MAATSAYGMRAEEIDMSTPAELEPYIQARRHALKELDTIVHMVCGTYLTSAIGTVIDHALSGRKARARYIEEPLLASEWASEAEKKIKEEQKLRKMLANEEAWRAAGLRAGLEDTKIKKGAINGGNRQS